MECLAEGSNKRFHPGFPATSPYVTSIGGTDFSTPGSIGAETAWSGSGGGFSDTFVIPKYQAAAVAKYKETRIYQISQSGTTLVVVFQMLLLWVATKTNIASL